MAPVLSQQLPAHGAKVVCVIENDPREGHSIWIDLEQLESQEHAQRLIDTLTGRADDPYPDGWNEIGTFEVIECRGLGPRLSALARDTEGPLIRTLADLAEAIQSLPPDQVEPFLAWAEGPAGEWWLPGYGGADWSIHPPEDAVFSFSLTTTTQTP